ncbi:uncharacterized protein LOC144887854 isoform X2 [Branchiostoma floridae x Branchiostoma japonicum]
MATKRGHHLNIEDFIQQNYVNLTKKLEVKSVIPYLMQTEILLRSDKERILAKVTKEDQAGELLDILTHNGKCTVDVFIHALEETKQTRLLDLLGSQYRKKRAVESKGSSSNRGDFRETAANPGHPNEPGGSDAIAGPSRRMMARSPGPEVFICHAGPDKRRFVRPLVQQLQQKGLPKDKIFFDAISIETGDVIETKIKDTLSSASLKLVVLVISHHVLKGRFWPKLEYELTLKANKKIFPIWLDQNDDNFAAFGSKLRKYSPTLKGIAASKVVPRRARMEIPIIAKKIVRKLQTA